jgi:hypothetical protein
VTGDAIACSRIQAKGALRYYDYGGWAKGFAIGDAARVLLYEPDFVEAALTTLDGNAFYTVGIRLVDVAFSVGNAAMRQIGAPALDALDRIAEQFGPREFNRSWHLQIDILRVAILAAVGRLDEARTLRSEVMTRAAQQDAPAELVAGLASIEAELTDASDP